MPRRWAVAGTLLAAASGYPDLGVIFAATGRMSLLQASEAASGLRTPNVRIHTLTKDDHVVCDGLRKSLAPDHADARHWACVDVATTKPWRAFRSLTAEGAACRSSHRLAPSRLLKMAAILASPYKASLFLDTDVVACAPLDVLYTQLRAATPGDGLLEVYDLLMVPAREAVHAASPKASWATPNAFAQPNSGVVFWRRTPAVEKLFTKWLRTYCARSGDADFNGGDQHVLFQTIPAFVKSDKLLLYHLLPSWNFRSWRRHFNNGNKCCDAKPRADRSGDPVPIFLDHDCRDRAHYLRTPQAAAVASARGNTTAAFFGRTLRRRR